MNFLMQGDSIFNAISLVPMRKDADSARSSRSVALKTGVKNERPEKVTTVRRAAIHSIVPLYLG